MQEKSHPEIDLYSNIGSFLASSTMHVSNTYYVNMYTNNFYVCSLLNFIYRRWMPFMLESLPPSRRGYNQRGPLNGPLFRIFLSLLFGCFNADFAAKAAFQAFSSAAFTSSYYSRMLQVFKTVALYSQHDA